MIAIHPPIKPSGGGKRVARFTVGTSTAGWTAADCDYLCDGTDDQVEINAAIQAFPATGGEVVILDGTYNITAKIAVNKACVTLSGNGLGSILKRMWNSRTEEGIVYISSNKSTVRNITLDGNGANHTSTYNSGVLVRGTTETMIMGIRCYYCKGEGIRLNTPEKVTIVGNMCNSCTYGIEAVSATYVTISGNVCVGNSVGIYMYGGSANVITGNTCSAGGTGIRLDSIIRSAVVGNSTSHGNIGIYLINCSVNTITGNTFVRGTGLASDYDNTQHTICLSGTANKNNLIAYNLIMGKNYTTEGGTGNTFTGNKYN